MSTSNELDRLFAEFEPRKPVVRKAAPISPLAKLQASLDALTGTGANRCDLSKSVKKFAAKPKRVRIVKFDPVTKRAMTRTDPLADENLGTTTARAIRKSEDEVDLYQGFVSKGQIDNAN